MRNLLSLSPPQIPEQIAVERAVVGLRSGNCEVIVVGIVEPETGVTVQVSRQVDESLDKAALERIALQVTASSDWRMAPL